MYKMTLKYKDLELSVESPTSIMNEVERYQQFMDNVLKVYNNGPLNPSKAQGELSQLVENVPVMDYNKDTRMKDDNITVIRERLPNRSNKVDLSQLTIETAAGTAHSHFRCPSCAQSAVLIANGTPIVRDIVNEDACFSVDLDINNSNRFTYEEACEKTLEQVRFTVGEGMNSTCPMCETTQPTEEFVKAYHQPLEYFESETPCPLCGEPLWLINENGQTFLACDEPCMFKKEVQND